MDDGFFSASLAMAVRPPHESFPRCEECGLYKAGCKTPKMRRDGDGRRKILIIGEFPAREDDAAGVPFVGKIGQYLERVLGELGVNMRRDCVLTNAARCHPPGSDLAKQPRSVPACRPLVFDDIAAVNPDVVILLGWAACRSVIARLWGKEDVGAVSRWAGVAVPAHTNYWVCPTYHPSFVCRQLDSGDTFVASEFRQHLRAAIKLSGSRPWPDGPPDYASQVEPIMSPAEAARRLDGYTSGIVAFDYETTCLKPDSVDSEIVCASVCWNGQETIAYPWAGDAIRATRRLLADPKVGKVMQNAAFEIRWTRAKLGVNVENCAFDTMLAAHAISPREKQKERGGGVTGLKFLAFARLGCPIYNSHIDPFLDSHASEKLIRGCYARNRVWDVDRRQLLVYCGLDSLLEFELAGLLAADLGVSLGG